MKKKKIEPKHFETMHLQVTLWPSMKLVKIEAYDGRFSKTLVHTFFIPLASMKYPYVEDFDNSVRYRLLHDVKVTCNHYMVTYNQE